MNIDVLSTLFTVSTLLELRSGAADGESSTSSSRVLLGARKHGGEQFEGYTGPYYSACLSPGMHDVDFWQRSGATDADICTYLSPPNCGEHQVSPPVELTLPSYRDGPPAGADVSLCSPQFFTVMISVAPLKMRS